MNVRQNYSSAPSFCAIKGNPKALVNRMGGGKALSLVMDQLHNGIADIVISENGAKVVARKGYSLPGELGKKGIREFEPSRYEPGWVYNADGDRVFVNDVDNKFYDSFFRSGNFQIGACKTIADLAYSSAIKSGKTSNIISYKTYEKIVGTIMDLDV